VRGCVRACVRACVIADGVPIARICARHSDRDHPPGAVQLLRLRHSLPVRGFENRRQRLSGSRGKQRILRADRLNCICLGERTCCAAIRRVLIRGRINNRGGPVVRSK